MKKIFLLFVFCFSLFFTRFSFCQWVLVSSGMGNSQIINSFAINDTIIYTGTYNAGIFITTNNGSSWSSINSGLTNLNVKSLLATSAYLFAGTFGDGIFISYNNGANWTAFNNGLSGYDLYVGPLVVNGSNIFMGNVGPLGNGVFRSTNYGYNWTNISYNFTNSHHVNALFPSGSNIYAGTGGGLEYGGVLMSSNSGDNWNIISGSIHDMDVSALISSGNNLYASCLYDTNGRWAIFYTSNNGANWTNIQNNLANRSTYSLALRNNNLFAGTDSGVFLTTNNGANWINKNQGFGTPPEVISLLITNGYIFAGTFGQSVWRRSLSEIIAINKISETVPSSYKLFQNYPNPFNPTTKIKFEVPPFEGRQGGMTVLKVYDILGKEIATLVNEKQSAGTYEVTFDGSKLSSGIYFYTLTTGEFKETKKLILLK